MWSYWGEEELGSRAMCSSFQCHKTPTLTGETWPAGRQSLCFVGCVVGFLHHGKDVESPDWSEGWAARPCFCCLEHSNLSFPLFPVEAAVWRYCEHTLFLGLSLTDLFGTFWFLSLLHLGGRYHGPVLIKDQRKLPSSEPHIEKASWKPKIKYYLHPIFQEVKKKLLC